MNVSLSGARIPLPKKLLQYSGSYENDLISKAAFQWRLSSLQRFQDDYKKSLTPHGRILKNADSSSIRIRLVSL